ncbi:DUF3892 domain-containing protein [Deltaproteobacteria bacterium TL4]
MKETKKIIGARRGRSGEIEEFLIEETGWISKEKAIFLAEQREINAVVIQPQNEKPYLRSRPDDTQSNNFSALADLYEPYLLFNGRELCWMENKKAVDCWPATSGADGYTSSAYQSLKDKGPILEGEWYVRQDRYQSKPPRGADWIQDLLELIGQGNWPWGESAWGKNRVWLIPKRKTVTLGRSGFSIHGGDTPGSAGCIDLTSRMTLFTMRFLSFGRNMILKVKY